MLFHSRLTWSLLGLVSENPWLLWVKHGVYFQMQNGWVQLITSSQVIVCVKVALTATATTNVRRDIITSLKMDNPLVFERPLARNNLYVDIVHQDLLLSNAFVHLAHFLDEKLSGGGSAIIYTRTKHNAGMICNALNSNGRRSLEYHRDLTQNELRANQAEWMNNNVSVIVATVAFGLGIDKQVLHLVAQYNMVLMQSVIISREGLILTQSILPCPQGSIFWSTPCRKFDAERLCMLHQNSGGIGKSIPSALQISLDPRDFPRALPSGNLSGLGKSFGRRGWISQYLPRLGGARIQSPFVTYFMNQS